MIAENRNSITLLLHSHSSKKLIKEACSILNGIYPYKIDEDKIIIQKTGRKGYYDVYISENRNKNLRRNVKNITISVSIIILILILSFIVTFIYKSHKEVITDQKEAERLITEKQQLQEQKKEQLNLLIREYEKQEKLCYQKIYPYIQHIYSVLDGNATIENLTIERDSFSVEVTTVDALKILSGFEENNSFSSIKMNRTTVGSGKESVIYIGSFSKVTNDFNIPNALEERIKFYENNLNNLNERTLKMKNVPLSEYISSIRNILHKNNCTEKYIQLRGSDNSAEIEFLILSSSRNILGFINEIQKGEDNLIYIKSFKLRNSEEKDHVQTVICFDSGIEMKDNELKISEYEDIQFSPSEIDSIFYKKPAAKKENVQKQEIKNTDSSYNNSQKNSQSKMKSLEFLGITKTNGKTFIMAKDLEMNSIYKLLLNDSETDEDCCFEIDSGYKAKINNEFYEVKK